MIRVAFLLNFSKEYKGGVNYIKNLVYTNSVTQFEDLEYFFIVPSDIEQDYIDMFAPYATIVKTDIFKSNTLPWFLNKVCNRLFQYQLPLINLFNKHKINVVSHSFFWGRYKSIKIVNWIPDFQCLHYPDLWTKPQLDNIIHINNQIVEKSDLVILSSQDALKDYKIFAPAFVNKARVLQFVSQPGEVVDNEEVFKQVEKLYGIGKTFFYLPNQFWTHKNHITALKAINLLKQEGLDPLLITTGVMNDFRKNNDNLNVIHSYIKDNDLDSNVKLLGVVPYEHVLVLMRKCIAVINPSLFEGWSSTVEEAKSIGKTVLLSDIAVHREQNPEHAVFFAPLNEQQLANSMKQVLQLPVSEAIDALKLKQQLHDRTVAFSTNYYNIVKNLLRDK